MRLDIVRFRDWYTPLADDDLWRSRACALVTIWSSSSFRFLDSERVSIVLLGGDLVLCLPRPLVTVLGTACRVETGVSVISVFGASSSDDDDVGMGSVDVLGSYLGRGDSTCC